MKNLAITTEGFETLRQLLALYIGRELALVYGDKTWWDEGVMNVLREEQRRNLPQTGDFEKLINALDIANCLLLFELHWQTVFRKKLSIDHRTWAKELVNTRNKKAHIGGVDFSADDTWRALDTMARLAEQIDPEGAESIRRLLRASRYGSTDGSTNVTEASTAPAVPKSQRLGILNTTPFVGLPAWRDVIEPHPDVAQGRYKNAEFAADLAQVARGEGAYEYRDPVEFFARTFVTEGITGLLEQSFRRVSGKDGEPVIQLKTAFGGGKTHSMLALYHIMRGTVSIDKIPNVKPAMERAGVATLPKANVAVLVGSALDPAKSKRPNYMPGITINTLWGEMTAQLAESAGNPKLYDYVKESDKKGVSPGSETLKRLFDACAPCIILMDELVTYGKKIGKKNDLPSGTFDNFIAFIQEITEAARASKNSLVVASIPESEIEIGGADGHKTLETIENAFGGSADDQKVLETIEHTIGRMEAIWKPVAPSEGFEVVRRRLFLDSKNPAARDKVCSAFSRMYNENTADFPTEARELAYKKRIESCYPIHPEIFDRLYDDWATLERFQRTRGVLRLMAAVIHELWMGNDAGLLIMPGSIPLSAPNIKNELTRHLPNHETWNPVVDREVDGKESIPYEKDQSNQRYGRMLAARRVARTIMLGSAPTVRAQTLRGLEASRIRLVVIQPGENIANFNDALNTLLTSLTYLYSNPSNNRFWYDTRPTLRKTVEDRATQIAPSDVEYEIETRLRGLRREPPFAGIHTCPASSLDVPDEQTVRLVILCPSAEYKSSNQSNTALKAIADIWNNRGNAPRIYRNMIAFIAPDQGLMTSLKQAVSLYLAWKSVKQDSETLNLDAAQNRETHNNLIRANETVEARIKETYCWFLYPYIDKKDLKTIVWDTNRISGGNDNMITKAAKKMLQNGAIITAWAPSLLKMVLDDILWRESDHIAIKTLWDYLSTYCYLPRLADGSVLEKTIQTGINSSEYFAFAAAFDGTRYIDLKFNQYIDTIEWSGYLVKVAAAEKQMAAEVAKRQAATSGVGPVCPSESNNAGGAYPIPDNDTNIVQETVDVPKNTNFYMSAQLDTTRIGRDVKNLIEEVINHLISVDGAQVEVSLEVTVKAEDGMSAQTVRTVSENCRTLRVQNFGFDG